MESLATVSRSRSDPRRTEDSHKCDTETIVQPKLLHLLSGHTDEITSVAFSPDSKMVASGSLDGLILIWYLDGTKPRDEVCKPFSASRGVNSVTFSGERDNYVLASCTDEAIEIWDPQTRQRMKLMGSPSKRLDGLAFSPDGTYLASGSYENSVYLWYAHGKSNQSLTANNIRQNRPRDLALSPNGRTLAVSHDTGKISLWDIQTSELLDHQIEAGHRKSARSVSLSPKDGAMLLSSSIDRSVCICDLKTGNRLHRFTGHTGWVEFSTWSPDGAFVTSASGDGTVRIWKIGQKDDSEHQVLTHGNLGATCVAFSPDGMYIVTCGQNGKIVVWTKSQNLWERTRVLEGHIRTVLSVLVSADSKRIISSGSDQTIRIWDIESGHNLNRDCPIQTAQPIDKMWFDSHSDSHVMTPYGAKSLDSSSSGCTLAPSWSPYWRCCEEEKDEEWIMWNDKRVIFLPKDFRPRVCAIFGHKVVVCTQRGQVYVYGFSETVSPGTGMWEDSTYSGR